MPQLVSVSSSAAKSGLRRAMVILLFCDTPSPARLCLCFRRNSGGVERSALSVIPVRLEEPRSERWTS